MRLHMADHIDAGGAQDHTDQQKAQDGPRGLRAPKGENTKKNGKRREENNCIDTWIIDIWIYGYINV